MKWQMQLFYAGSLEGFPGPLDLHKGWWTLATLVPEELGWA